MNKPNPDADLLRRAATLARETANAATEGPWTPERKGVLDPDDIQFVETTRRDASHIALWHPGVALAIADWLDQHAEHHDYDECTRETCHAETTARALLNEPEDT